MADLRSVLHELLLQTWIATGYVISKGESKIGDQKTVAEILFHWRL